MTTYEIHSETKSTQFTAVATATLSVTELGSWLGSTYNKIAQAITAQGSAIAGPPFARFHPLDDGRFMVEAGFPVSTKIDKVDGVRGSELPPGQVAATVHVGPYDQMEPAYQALSAWVTEHGGEAEGDAWEIYLSLPTGDPSTWRTEIVQPYRQAA